MGGSVVEFAWGSPKRKQAGRHFYVGLSPILTATATPQRPKYVVTRHHGREAVQYGREKRIERWLHRGHDIVISLRLQLRTHARTLKPIA